jgi:hypothetical protein
VKYTNSQKVLLVLDRYLLPLLLPFLRFPPSLTLSSLSSSFVGMTSVFFAISLLLGEYSLGGKFSLFGFQGCKSFPARGERLLTNCEAGGGSSAGEALQFASKCT